MQDTVQVNWVKTSLTFGSALEQSTEELKTDKFMIRLFLFQVLSVTVSHILKSM